MQKRFLSVLFAAVLLVPSQSVQAGGKVAEEAVEYATRKVFDECLQHVAELGKTVVEQQRAIEELAERCDSLEKTFGKIVDKTPLLGAIKIYLSSHRKLVAGAGIVAAVVWLYQNGYLGSSVQDDQEEYA